MAAADYVAAGWKLNEDDEGELLYFYFWWFSTNIGQYCVIKSSSTPCTFFYVFRSFSRNVINEIFLSQVRKQKRCGSVRCSGGVRRELPSASDHFTSVTTLKRLCFDNYSFTANVNVHCSVLVRTLTIYNGITLNSAILACYIDIVEEPYDPDRVYSQWNDLPDLLLEQIFSYLTIRERYYASLVSVTFT